jgi:hypothetical protein
MQDKKHKAFYVRKLNAAQTRYTITERELLSTIETCKEYLVGLPNCHGLCSSSGSFNVKTLLKTHSLLALTMTDLATGWFEIVQATSKAATSTQDLFHNTCLARYPRPQFMLVDNGCEFKCALKQMCENYGIKAKLITSHKHQVCAIMDEVYKVVNNMLRSFELEKKNLEVLLSTSSKLVHGL